MKTAEEILAKYTKEYFASNSNIYVAKNDIIKAMEEYANQPKNNNKMSLEDLHRIISNPNTTDGFEVHLKHCWDSNNAKSVFHLTGLDVSQLLKT